MGRDQTYDLPNFHSLDQKCGCRKEGMYHNAPGLPYNGDDPPVIALR